MILFPLWALILLGIWSVLALVVIFWQDWVIRDLMSKQDIFGRIDR